MNEIWYVDWNWQCARFHAQGVCGNPQRAKQMLACSPSSSLSHFISFPFSTAWLVFFSVMCQMITWILRWVGRFKSTRWPWYPTSACEHIWVLEPRAGLLSATTYIKDLVILHLLCTAATWMRGHCSSEILLSLLKCDFEFFHGAQSGAVSS